MLVSKVSNAFMEAARDLVWLDDHGAMGGVAEILRERRRQIEVKGYDAAHDDSQDAGAMIMQAEHRLRVTRARICDGVPVVLAFRQAGALLAAEMDRLLRHQGGS
jgi:hypothetical protein